jgi:hypothetical protein
MFRPRRTKIIKKDPAAKFILIVENIGTAFGAMSIRTDKTGGTAPGNAIPR